MFGVVLAGCRPQAQGIAAALDPAVDRARRAVDVDLRAHDTHRDLDELGKRLCARGAGRAALSKAATVARHVLRNAAIPVVTVAALEIGNLLAGAVIVETVFAWPGIGQLAIQSIQSRDFLVVQLIVLFDLHGLCPD